MKALSFTLLIIFAFTVNATVDVAEKNTPKAAITVKSTTESFFVKKGEGGSGSGCPEFLNQKINKLNSSQQADLCKVTQGKVVLIVNTASHCGYTPQFEELELIHQRYKDQGLVVLGFPSDDFFQEEDEQSEIADICFVNYGVSFMMLEPVHVWGDNSHTIFRHLAERSSTPKWNFYKYVVSENGEKVTMFNSKVTPNSKSLIDVVEAALKKNKS